MQNKQAVIYCRVSTKEQVEEGNSLSTQEKLCREYALKNAYDIAEVFIEQGESAKTANRPELQRLLSYCSDRKKQINAVIAYKLDRISRNTDDYSYIRILLKRYGIEIKFTSEHFENSPAGRFMENIISNVSQFDNDVRTERCAGGMRDAVREGRYVWSAPYGYSNVKVAGKSTIGLNQDAPLLRRVFEEVAKNIQPSYHIWKEYSAKGLLTRGGKPISRSQFYRLLRNELFTGWISKFGERHKGAFEPLISEELFHQVQWVLDGRGKKTTCYIVNNPDFPLRRFMTHPNGLKLTGAWSKGKKRKYAYYRYFMPDSHFPKDTLEELFIEFLNSFALDDELYIVLKEKVHEQLGKQTRNERKQAETIKKHLSELETMQMDMYKKNYKGILSDTMLKKQLERLEDEEMKLKRSLILFPEVNVDFDALVDLLREFLQSPGEVWRKAKFNLKIKLQGFEFPSGVLFDGRKFRTPEICNHFKAKTLFLTTNSLLVDSKDKITNTPKTTNSAPFKNKKDEVLFWNGLGEELIELNSIATEYYRLEAVSPSLDQKTSPPVFRPGNP
jgi:DNA invertase Pin-like site-specific DNA recombinase